MPEIVDDKSEHCLPFLLEQLQRHQARHANEVNPPPFFIGLNGVQGVGKTVLVNRKYLHLTFLVYNYNLRPSRGWKQPENWNRTRLILPEGINIAQHPAVSSIFAPNCDSFSRRYLPDPFRPS